MALLISGIFMGVFMTLIFVSILLFYFLVYKNTFHEVDEFASEIKNNLTERDNLFGNYLKGADPETCVNIAKSSLDKFVDTGQDHHLVTAASSIFMAHELEYRKYLASDKK